MKLFNGLTVDEVIERQAELFLRLPVVVEPDSREDDCYPNCVTKKERMAARSFLVGEEIALLLVAQH